MLSIGLSKPELFHLAQEAVQFIFADENVKMSLKEVFKHAEKRLTMLSDIGVPNWCVSLLDQYEYNCVTYAKKNVYACYFLFMYGLCIFFQG